MKGLLLKDWYMVVKEAKYYLFFFIVYAVLAAFSGTWMILVSINMILGSMVVKSLMAKEEQNRWDSFAVMLPVSAKEKVMEKYLIGFGGGMAANMISFLVLGIAKLAFQRNTDMPLLPFFLLYTAFTVLYIAFELPVLFKFGTINGRLVFVIVCGILTGVSVGVSSLLGEIAVKPEAGIRAGVMLPVLAAVLVFTAVAAIISVKLSFRIYEKREF
ncbi:MAG: ABC-2 transporter permease [Eubacteriales bacterium]|nr:ABC-2 transporter permease [Eubacteriales bacterium]